MIRILAFIALSFFLNTLEAKPVELVLWHSFAGNLGGKIRHLSEGFNQSQDDYVIKLVYKGEYIESLTSFAAAFRAKQPPALVQIFEVGSGVMLHPKGIIKPVDEIMQEQGLSLPTDNFLPAVRAFYSEANHLLAMPFNISIPVIYYNTDALEKLGYGAGRFPSTWDDMEILARRLKQAGYACAYTSAYPAWIHIESFSALHGLPMIDATATHVTYNNSAIINHLQRLKNWQQKHYFEYGGRASDATVLFSSGRCALFSQSSGDYNSLSELVNFRLGVALLPLDINVSKNRHNNVAGGAALWAVAGQTPQIYRGIAQFFSYIAQFETQQWWHQNTGYLPLGAKGIYATLANKSSHPILKLAEEDLNKSEVQPIKLHAVGPQSQIRTINDEALEAIFAGIKTAKDAINEATQEADYALLRFARNTADKR